MMKVKQEEVEKENGSLLAKMKEANDEIKTLEVTRDLLGTVDRRGGRGWYLFFLGELG